MAIYIQKIAFNINIIAYCIILIKNTKKIYYLKKK